MEQKKQVVSCDGFPPLSPKYPLLFAQNANNKKTAQETIISTIYTTHCLIIAAEYLSCLGNVIRGCFHGWMIFSNHPRNDIWSLWNPSSTSDIISLPPLILKDGDYQSIGQCCLSVPPDDPNSVILSTRTNKPTFVFCQLSCKRKKKLRNKPRWIEMSYSHQLKRITWNGTFVHSLTCCNGKVFALNTDGCITRFVLQVEIVVRDEEIVIKLILFGSAPFPPTQRSSGWISFLKGSSTELFYIIVGFHDEAKKTPGDVYLFKLNMNSINWEKLKGLKNWDMTGMILDELGGEDYEDLEITLIMWEEMQDLKGAIFFVDLARYNSIFYNPAIASELKGLCTHL